jgi:sugar lactone lactonase YvrE
MLGRCLALALLPFAVITACSDDGPIEPHVDGTAGEGGDTGGGGCAERGTGTLSIEVSGLPSSVDADVTLTTPSGSLALSAAETLDDAPGGTYAITAKRVFDADPIVRTVYEPTITTRTTCLADGATEELSVSYAAIPSSNKLWTSEASGFSSDDLAETADVEPSVQITAPIGKEVAFDQDGNLWTKGATLAEPHIVRLPASSLGSSGEREFDRGINLPIECLPSVRSIAFDPKGNLFVSACGGEVLKIAAASLGASGDVPAAAVISGLEDTQDLAFDAGGNLWTTDAGKIIRFDAARLAASTSDAPDLSITARNDEDSRDLGATDLAFDADGNLWGFDFGSNDIFELSAADLDGTGEESVVSEVTIAVGVDVLLNRGAFDDGGGLWISYGNNRLARLSPAQLLVSVPSGDAVDPERIITSDAVASDLRVGFFPAAADLPLYHSLR